MSYNTSVGANLNTGKFNFFTNYGYNKNRRHYKMSGERLDQNQYYESVSTLINEFHFIKSGFDYIINDKK